MSVPPPPPPPQAIAKAPPQSQPVSLTNVLPNKGSTLARVNAAGCEEVSKYKDYSESEGSNPGRDWLTYESVYNHVKFQHTKSVVPTGAYLIPMKDIRIIASSGLSDKRLEFLRQAFFPQTKDLDDLKSILYNPWNKSPDGKWSQQSEDSWAAQVQRRPEYATMPYNVMANDPQSQAIGTRAIGTDGRPFGITMLTGQWPTWQTASRSCVIRLESTADAVESPLKLTSEGLLDWQSQRTGNNPLVPFVSKNTPPKIPVGTAFNMFPKEKPQWDSCYGIKTGVFKVGQAQQDGKEGGTGRTMGGKGALEKESIVAALRSEYLMDVRKMFYQDRFNAMNVYANPGSGLMNEIIILPEVLTVTCTNPAIDGGSRDGFQLRDISGLDPSKKYFPPISIPFVSFPKPGSGAVDYTKCDFTTPASPWAAIGEIDKRDGWINLWADSFAKRLGRAKAILHIHYGLQCLTPNSQNFLLEFDDTMSTVSKVVLRDVMDMKLHSEWVQTVMGPSLRIMAAPPLASSLTDFLQKSSLKTAIDLEHAPPPVDFLEKLPPSIGLNRLLLFEATLPSLIADPQVPEKKLLYDSETSHHSYMGTGDGRSIQYYKGTQLNFVNYTALFKGFWVESQPSSAPGKTRPANWTWILYANIRWAYSHAQAYTEVLAKNIERFPTINIDALPLKITSDELSGKRDRCKTFIDDKGASVDATKQTNSANEAKFAFSANAETIKNLTNDKAGWERAGQLHELFCLWERAVSDQIHSALYSNNASRLNLRKYVWDPNNSGVNGSGATKSGVKL